MVKQKEYNLDTCTFGKSQAAINLVTILQKPEYSRYSHKVLSMLSKYMTAISSLTGIPHKETRETALGLWCKTFVGLVEEAELPLLVKTHMNNVAVGQKRKLLKRKE